MNPKYTLFNESEAAAAAAHGWGIHHVYDLATNAWSVRILPTHMAGAVLNLAKANQPLPLKALRLIKEFRGA